MACLCFILPPENLFLRSIVLGKPLTIESICMRRAHCIRVFALATQLTKYRFWDPAELQASLGSLMSPLLETVYSGTMHPETNFKENRFILEQPGPEKIV